MATEKSIDEQIKKLQKQLDENIREEQQCKKQAFDEQGKSIDDKIEALQRQTREEEEEEEKKKRKETFIKKEKRLLCLIESQHSIIEFLSSSLESEEKKLEYLEVQLKLLRDSKYLYK